MMKLKLPLLTIFFLVLFVYIHSEINKIVILEDNLEEYFDRVEELVEEKNDDLTSSKILEIYNSKYFSGEDSIKVRLVKNSIAILPNYISEYYQVLDNYYQMVEFFIGSEDLGYKDFLCWFNNLEFIIRTNKSNIPSFLSHSKLFFKHKILFKSKNLIWKVEPKNYSFRIVDDILELVFSNTKLIAFGKNDSIVINNTSGNYTFLDLKWRGKGGSINWEKVGKSNIYAKIKCNYTLKTSKFNIKFDTCEFYNKRFFPKPLMGKIEDKLVKKLKVTKANYPKFLSFRNDIDFKNIVNSFFYKGGVKQYGKYLRGIESKRDPVDLEYKADNGMDIIFSIKELIIKDNILESPSASMKISYKGLKDFIIHNYVKFKYSEDDDILNIKSKNTSASKISYIDNYHNLAFRADRLLYNKKKNRFVITNNKYGSLINKVAVFESTNYFDEKLFLRIFGRNNVHPFSMIKRYLKKYPYEKDIEISFYSSFLRQSPDEVKLMINSFSKDGFVFYDNKKKSFRVLDKLSNYLKFFTKNKDYDQIKFTARINSKGYIGIMYLDDLTLEIFKPQYIAISKNKNVHITPIRKLIYNKGGDFSTGGKLVVGPLNMYGEGFKFNYKKYSMTLEKVDLLKIQVATGNYDEYGNPVLKTITSDIENISGLVQIDYPSNKSGRYNFKQYPSFICKNYSYIYWDHPSIQKGAYLKNKFYYKLEPFVLDSLSEGRTTNIVFDGEFISSIFDPFKQQLTIQKDFSLGFKIKVPKPGKRTYRKALYNGTILLNSHGLQADGRLVYKNIDISSKNMLFLLDKFECDVDPLTITESQKTNTPSFHMTKVKMNWEIPNDSMLFNTNKTAILIGAKPQIEFHGQILYYKDKFYGNGEAEFSNVELRSESINFLYNDIKSDNSYFGIKDSIMDEKLFEIDSAKYVIDLKEMKAKFDFGDNTREMLYPISEFKSESSDLNLDLKTLDFTSDSLRPSFKMTSLRTDMEMLSFYASGVKFDNKTKVLDVDGVESIIIYTSLIKLPNKKLKVNKGGKIDKISGVEIFLDEDHIHRMVDSEIDINSAQSYRASGKYIYTAKDKVVDTLNVESIAREIIGMKGKAVVEKEKLFRISPNFKAYGDVVINSLFKTLELDGYVKLSDLEIDTSIKTSFLKTDTHFLNDSLYFPLNEMKIGTGIGLFYNTSNNLVYPTYLSKKLSRKDFILLSTDSLYMAASAVKNEIKITSSDKFKNPKSLDNMISFNKKTGDMKGYGKLILANNMNRVSLETFGTYDYKYSTKKVDIATSLLMNFYLDKSITKVISNFFALSLGIIKTGGSKVIDTTKYSVDSLNVEVEGEDPVTRTDLLAAIQLPFQKIRLKKEIVGLGMDKDDISKYMLHEFSLQMLNTLIAYTDTSKTIEFLEEYYDDIEEDKFYMGDDVEKKFIFNNVNFRYYPNQKAYISNGKISIFSVGGNKINRDVDGLIKITHKKRKTSFTMYIKLNEKDWFYVDYVNRQIAISSSNREILEAIAKIDSDDRYLEEDEDEGLQEYYYGIKSKERLRSGRRKLQLLMDAIKKE